MSVAPLAGVILTCGINLTIAVRDYHDMVLVDHAGHQIHAGWYWVYIWIPPLLVAACSIAAAVLVAIVMVPIALGAKPARFMGRCLLWAGALCVVAALVTWGDTFVLKL